jgi:hypothetical protein
VQAQQPHSLILLPQMLRAWCGFLMQTGQRAPASLKLVAVGGAAVGASLIGAAQALGIPACEGYGLSEGCSVQTLNLPWSQRPGSVGRVLPHCPHSRGSGRRARSRRQPVQRLPRRSAARCPTGGHRRPRHASTTTASSTCTGRKKNVLITAIGRNVSPNGSRPRCAATRRCCSRWCSATASRRSRGAVAGVAGDRRRCPAGGRGGRQCRPSRLRPHRPLDPRPGRLRTVDGPRHGNGRPQRDAVARMHADALELRPALTP